MKNVWLIASLLLFVNNIHAQVDYSGTEFWFNSCDVTPPLTSDNFIRIIGNVATTGTVAVPGTGFSQDFCFNSGGAQVDVFIPPGDYGLTSSNIIQNTAIQITADNEIMVVYFPKAGVDSDYYLVPPKSSLDQEYYVNMPKGSGFWNPAYTQITASENLTTVSIYNPNSELGPFSWGVGNDIPINTTTSIVLNQGESYRIQAGQDVSTGPASNLQYSGTQIISDKPVFVSSAMSTNLPDLSIPYADELRSELLPRSKWGTSYYTAPFEHGQAYMIHVLSVDNSNSIVMDGSVVATLNQYESFDTIVSGAKHITSSAEVNIAECSLSKGYTFAAIGDPSQLNLISESNFDTQFHDYLNTFGADIDSVIYMMTVQTSAISSTTINGTPVSPSLFVPIAGTSYSHGVISYAIAAGSGQFIEINSSAPMMVYKSAMQKAGSGSYEWQVSRNMGRLQNVPNTNVYDPTDCSLIIVLPVEILNFDGTAESGYNHLEWVTASENQNDYFKLERSENLQDFEEIAIIEGAFNSSSERYYDFRDVSMTSSINYYRLTQVDVNGSSNISKVISLTSKQRMGDFYVYPNPAENQLNINFDTESMLTKSELLIHDMCGKLQYSQVVDRSSGTKKIEISQLASGLYTITIQSNSGRLSKRFIKK